MRTYRGVLPGYLKKDTVLTLGSDWDEDEHILDYLQSERDLYSAIEVEDFSTNVHWRELVTYFNSKPHVRLRRVALTKTLVFAFDNISRLVNAFDVVEL